MSLPKLIAPAKRILESGIQYNSNPERAYITYESNIEYEVSVPFVQSNTLQTCQFFCQPPAQKKKK